MTPVDILVKRLLVRVSNRTYYPSPPTSGIIQHYLITTYSSRAWWDWWDSLTSKQRNQYIQDSSKENCNE